MKDMKDSRSPVRGARLAAGLSQAELARRAGMDHTFISRIESGRTSPDVRTLQRLAKAIGCPVADLVTP